MKKLLAIIGLIKGYKGYKKGKSGRYGRRRSSSGGTVSSIVRKLSGSR